MATSGTTNDSNATDSAANSHTNLSALLSAMHDQSQAHKETVADINTKLGTIQSNTKSLDENSQSASTQAITARDHALSASTEATAAKEHALTASTDATAAKEHAITASTEASSAKEHAITASTEATSAKEHAITASTNSEIIKGHTGTTVTSLQELQTSSNTILDSATLTYNVVHNMWCQMLESNKRKFLTSIAATTGYGATYGSTFEAQEHFIETAGNSDHRLVLIAFQNDLSSFGCTAANTTVRTPSGVYQPASSSDLITWP